MKKNNKGFLLAELVLAIAVLSLGVVAALKALSFCAKISGFSGDLTKAIFLLENKISEFELAGNKVLPPDDTTENKTPQKFLVTLGTEDLEGASILKLECKARWKKLNTDQEVNLNLLTKNDKN